MTGSRRRYALVLTGVLAAAVLLVGGARAWGSATVHRTTARCDRPAVVAASQGPAANGAEPGAVRGPGQASGSWRAHMLRVAGCGAWRQVHDRIQRRHQYSQRRA